MSLKKKEWVVYGRKAKFIEINVKDAKNQTIDFFKLKNGNTRDIKRILSKIKNKYGFDLMQFGENWLEYNDRCILLP